MRAKHRHQAHSWDGHYEHCKCGASSGDRRDAKGYRCISFDDWEEDN